MLRILFTMHLVMLSCGAGCAFGQSNRSETGAALVTVSVNSPSMVFSPANWAGDAGRSGERYMQTWNAGAYFRFYWSSSADSATAKILIDTSTFADTVRVKPLLTYELDGRWTQDVPIASEISLTKQASPGHHVLTVFLQSSEQEHRWGAPGISGSNVLRVLGMQIGPTDRLDPPMRGHKWILEIGDSITEGIGAAATGASADALGSYSYLVGQALKQRDFEFSNSACGWSGWLKPGDGGADVPAYYMVSGTIDGRGGTYVDSASRWNKVDGRTSLLDAAGHLSGYGGRNQEPNIITINYGTNDGLRASNESDLRASVAQALRSLRRAAPNAEIFVIIPFGRYSDRELRAGIAEYERRHADKRLFIIDLGVSTALALAGPSAPAGTSSTQNGPATPPNRSEIPLPGAPIASAPPSGPRVGGRPPSGYWGNLHPNARGHAVFAARILEEILKR